jgi:hypothetical protein
MYPYRRKITAESVFHFLPYGRVQRSAGGGEDTVYAGGRRRIRVAGCVPDVSLDLGRPAGNGGIRWHRQDLIGDPVGFLFKCVAGLAHRHFRLEGHTFLLLTLRTTAAAACGLVLNYWWRHHASGAPAVSLALSVRKRAL